MSPNWRLAPDGTGVRIEPETASGPGSGSRVCRFKIVTVAKEQSAGTLSGGSAVCPYSDCGRVIDGDSIKVQAQAGDMGEQLYAIAYKRRVPKHLKSGKRGKDRWARGFRAPQPEDDNTARIRDILAHKLPEWEALDIVPCEEIPDGNKTTEPHRYGMRTWRDLFSPRQLLCHGTSVEVFREMLDADRENDEFDDVRRIAYGYLALTLDHIAELQQPSRTLGQYDWQSPINFRPARFRICVVICGDGTVDIWRWLRLGNWENHEMH